MTMPDITIVVAVAHKKIANRNAETGTIGIGIIGKDNALPWRTIPEDMNRFRTITMGGALIMGRRTFDSIGKPLPGRENIVVSRKCQTIEGCQTASSPEAALDIAKQSGKKIFIIGGEQIYRELLPQATVIRLTDLSTPDIPMCKGANFPLINPKEWRMEKSEHMRNRKYGRFLTYRRKPLSADSRENGNLI